MISSEENCTDIFLKQRRIYKENILWISLTEITEMFYSLRKLSSIYAMTLDLYFMVLEVELLEYLRYSEESK